MAPRVYWSGHLRLSLVSIAVQMFAATERGNRLALHQIHGPTGKRVRYEKVVPGVGAIDKDEIIKGFEFDKDRYVTLDSDELEQIKLESRKIINLVQFVGYDEIDPRYYDRPYYIVPDGDVAAEGFAVIRKALEDAKKVGLGEVAMRGRECLVGVKPCGRGLLLETLRYADEVRNSDSIFNEIKEVILDQEMVELADELIKRKTAAFDPSAFEDSYAAALRELIDHRREGEHVITDDDDKEQERSGEVIDLMEALKKSVAKGKPASRRGSSQRQKKSTRSPRRKAS